MSTGGKALGLVGWCGNMRLNSSGTCFFNKYPAQLSMPASGLTRCSVKPIRMDFFPIWSLISSVTVW